MQVNNARSVFKILLVTIVLCTFPFKELYAGPIDPAEQLEKEEHQRRVQAELARIPERVKIPKDQGMRFQPFKGCLLIKNIHLVGDEYLHGLLHPKERGYISPYLNRCVNSSELNELIIKLNTTLFDKGYVTARIEIEKYDKKQHALTIKIQEGRIEKITTTSLNRYTAFPWLIGKQLKTQDLQQGLEQLNRLPSRTSVITLWPAEEIGGTIVKVDTKKIGKPYRLYLAFDNAGSKQTGQNVVKSSLVFDDLLSLNDQLSLSGSKSGLGRDRSAAVTWKEEIPFGYYTLSYSGSYSNSQYDIDPKNKSSEFTTNSLKNKIHLSRNVYQGLNNHFSLGTSFWRYLPHQESAGGSLSDRNLSVIEVVAYHDYYHPVFRVVTELNYSQGVKLFGAWQDSSDSGIGAMHAQFKRYKLTSDYLWKIAQRLSLNGNLQLQYAEQGLPGVMKLPVLDEIGGIRGIKANGLTLDDGVILRHDLVFSSSLTRTVQNKTIRELSISPFVHGDLGWARDKGHENKLRPFIAIGGGLKINFWGFNGQVALSKLIKRPAEVKGDGWVVLFELNQKAL